MISRDELTKEVENIIGKELLATANKVDTNANGVQILGSDKVTKLALGVSATYDFFHEAVTAGAEYCITHHGIHLDSRYIYNSRLDPAQQKILSLVFASNMTAAGYHAALDMHPEIGNSSVVIRELGAKRLNLPYYANYGWVAEFTHLQDVKKLADKCSDLFQNDVFAVYAGPEKIRRIGVCTGGAKLYGSTLHEVKEKGVELHITGEISHSGIHIAKECGFNYFAGGHYATEVFGVQELGKLLKKKFGDQLEVEFIDIPNPL